MKRIYRGMMVLLAVLMVMGTQAQAGTDALPDVHVTPIVAQNEYGSVTYPVLEGHPDAAIQEAVNKAIYDTAQIGSRLNTLNSLAEGGWGLEVTYWDTLKNNILSVLVSAYGEMPNGRMGQTYTAVNYDLRTGKALSVEDLFSDVEGAFAFMEQTLEEQVAPELSGYMENDALTPIPRDTFFLTADGITFYYPQSQFAMLSGYSGGCSFFYYELAEYLKLDPDSPLARLGADAYLSVTADTAARAAESASEGRLPGIGASLGDSLMDQLNEYRLLVDPDLIPGSRIFEMEAPQMRGIWLLTDALTEEYDQSQVLGIRADRVNLFGIRPGVTTKEEWRQALGAPESTVELDDSAAGDYRLPAGTSDYYTYGETKLRLHAGEDGVLVSVQLQK